MTMSDFQCDQAKNPSHLLIGERCHQILVTHVDCDLAALLPQHRLLCILHQTTLQNFAINAFEQVNIRAQ